MHFQALRDRLLLWFSHCEMEMTKLQSETIGLEESLGILDVLHEELEEMDSPRGEIRDLGRSLVEQGALDLQSLLDCYLIQEKEILLKLASLRVISSQKQQLHLQKLQQPVIDTPPCEELLSVADSGVCTYADCDTNQRDSPVILVKRNIEEQQVMETKLPETETSHQEERTCVVSTISPILPPSFATIPVVEAVSESLQTVDQRRTYADVARTPAQILVNKELGKSSGVSVKSDAERQLELALGEWKQRLSRLDDMVITSEPSEVTADPNDIVSFTKKDV